MSCCWGTLHTLVCLHWSELLLEFLYTQVYMCQVLRLNRLCLLVTSSAQTEQIVPVVPVSQLHASVQTEQTVPVSPPQVYRLNRLCQLVHSSVQTPTHCAPRVLRPNRLLQPTPPNLSFYKHLHEFCVKYPYLLSNKSFPTISPIIIDGSAMH